MSPREQAAEVMDWHIRLAAARARFWEKARRGEWPQPAKDNRPLDTFTMSCGLTEEELRLLPF